MVATVGEVTIYVPPSKSPAATSEKQYVSSLLGSSESNAANVEAPQRDALVTGRPGICATGHLLNTGASIAGSVLRRSGSPATIKGDRCVGLGDQAYRADGICLHPVFCGESGCPG
jgi:hypothetical protein